MAASAGGGHAPIIIKKVKKHGHGDAHGNTTWKIALADFMTALFIIFLLLWLIKQTTPEQRSGIADYFAPASASRSYSGSGQPLGGQVIAQPGAMTSRASVLGPPGGGPSTPDQGEGNTEIRGYPGTVTRTLADKVTTNAPPVESEDPAVKKVKAEQQQKMAKQIRQMIQDAPELQGLEQNVQLEPTPEGLNIVLVDSERQEMFGKASSTATPALQKLMTQVSKVIATVPNKIAISGHTDSVAFGAKSAYSNWELSSDRANASRRLLAAAGIPDDRIATVTGKADREPLDKSDPNAPRNRRISLTVLTEPVPAAASQATASAAVPMPGPGPEGPLIKR